MTIIIKREIWFYTFKKETRTSYSCLTHICHLMSTICGILSLLSYTVPFAADSWVIVTEPVPEEGSMLLAGSSIRTRSTQQPTTTMTMKMTSMLAVTTPVSFSSTLVSEVTTTAGYTQRTTVVFSRTSIHVGVWTMCPHVFMSPSNKSTHSS